MGAVSLTGLVRRYGGVRGAALLEFVLIFPILLMVVFGIWEFGRIFDAWLVSTNASREGARYATEWTTADGDFTTFVKNKVTAYVNSGYGPRLNLGDVHIGSSDIVVETPTSDQVRVIVTARVDIWAPAVSGLNGGGPFTVTSWTTMRTQ